MDLLDLLALDLLAWDLLALELLVRDLLAWDLAGERKPPAPILGLMVKGTSSTWVPWLIQASIQAESTMYMGVNVTMVDVISAYRETSDRAMTTCVTSEASSV